ncbi:hypothetical protein V565_130420 [Rhizoctonia solani 123E]|uniref:MYND-type domain-containing protein n=1 Tax=Rhizoctonia solani 123E TaxID=1423351 RepID=A0A074RN16_9AGAM|nr:hypothetical protein V565_130420 [Rhizoctonia solani 123E]
MSPYGPPLSEYPEIFTQHFPRIDPWTQEDTKRFLIIKHEIPDESLSELALLERILRHTQISQYLGRVPMCPEGSNPFRYYLAKLEKYTAKHKLFSHYYGFLCVHTIARMFHIGILAYYEALPHLMYKGELKFDPTERDDCSIQLADMGALTFERQHDGPGFKKVVEFYPKDAEMLFNLIWSDRKAFTVVCRRTRMRGWSSLFRVLWMYLRDLELIRADQYCKGLRHLLMRYSLVASFRERELAIKTILVIEDTFPIGGQEFMFVPVDHEDARNTLDVFREYLKPTDGEPNSKAIYSIFDLVFYTALFIGRDEVVSLLEMILRQAWDFFELNLHRNITHKIKDAFIYGARAIWTVGSIFESLNYATLNQRTIAITAGLQVINQPELLELLGRVSSLLAIQSGNELIVAEVDGKKLINNVEPIMDALSRLTFPVVAEMEQIWRGLYQFIDIQHTLTPDGPVRNRILACQRLWSKVGIAFKFKPKAAKRNLCMNPRCPDPDPIMGTRSSCRRCCWVYYCSSRCQALHWLSTFWDSHHRQCISIGV